MGKKLALEGKKKIKNTSAGFCRCTPTCDQVNPREKKLQRAEEGEKLAQMEGRQCREELGLSRHSRMLAGFTYHMKLPGPQSQALAQQPPLPATSPPPQKQHRGHWVMLEGPIKNISAHGMAPQLCFDMPTPRISRNQAENTSYHMGLKHSAQELSSLILSGSYKTHFREYLCI